MIFTGTLIQAQIRQDCVGGGCKRSPWERLLPILGNPNKQDTDRLFYLLPSGSLLSEKFRGTSLSKQKFQKKEQYFDSRQRLALFHILTRDIGLGVKISEVLVDRPINHFKRIEDFISGIVDSLWLADERVFLFKSDDSRILRDVVRKVFCVGADNLSLLVDMWKEWGNHLFHLMAETVTIGTVPVPGRCNIFTRLNRLEVPRRVREGDRSMLLMQHVSHLISSRQLPYMGAKTEIKSRQKFKDVLQQDFKPDPETIVKLGMAARRIGGICKTIRSTAIPRGSCHISVTSSGEYNFPVARGAQAKAVTEAMVRILTVVPVETKMEDTPFGLASHIEGIPLWKTLFRKEVLETEEPFLTPYSLIKDLGNRFVGLDEVLGNQLMYVAWREYSPIPVLRTEVVPEMGNKARHVTLSEYWLNVIQAPLAHLLVEAVKYHPSVFSSFHRQDQAFEAVKGLCRLKRPQLDLPIKRAGPTEYVLSSDLKDATNAQNWAVTKSLLTGFINGYGLSSRPEYVSLVLSLIGPRIVQFPDFETIVSKQGIMMGEAIAKPSLTLLNLSIEELAFLRYLEVEEEVLRDNTPAPYRDWRYVHIGGDDHLARGPWRYLNLITQIHLSAGSHISPGQHGYSKICVRYTERLINLTNLKYGKPFNEDHNLSVIVDSVKVRLLERGQSTLIKKDNKNVAIGKSQQLGGTLEWLPKDNRFFSETKKASIRALFVERMGSLLPRKAVNPRAFANIHLPTSVGGYGLGMKSELKSFLLKSPKPTQWIVYKALMGIDVRKDCRIFRTLNTNTSSRGVEDILRFQEDLVDRLNDYPTYINAMSWWEVKDRYPQAQDNARRVIALAADDGILSVEDFVKRATRGNLFQELLLGVNAPKVFNTRKYVDTYQKVVWTYYEKEGGPDWDTSSLAEQTNEDITRVISKVVPMWFFDINQETTVDVGKYDPETGEETYEFLEGRYLDLYTKGLPSLNVSPKRLGLRC